MLVYKIMFKNTTYTEYILYDTNGIESYIKIDIIKNKLFHEDSFTLQNNNVDMVHSNVRNSKYISGVLILNGTTYGKK